MSRAGAGAGGKPGRGGTAVSPARLLAHEVLVRIGADGAYADRALHAALDRRALDEREAALATELVYGTLRQTLRLDFLLAKLATRSWSKLPMDTLAALRLGAYQLLHTRVPDHGAVGEAVALVRRRHEHQAGFANAILRELARRRDAGTLPDPARELGDPIEALAVATAHPRWVLAQVWTELGEAEARAWAEANNAVAPLTLRVNPLRAEVAEVAARLTAAGASARPVDGVPGALSVTGGGAPQRLPGFGEGAFSVQDPAAQLVGHLCAPAPESVIVDACAAPGGKATQLAELMGDRGTVLAVEVHAGRSRLIAANVERLGLASVVVAIADATDRTALAQLLAEHGRAHADLVLVDAPCSGMGTLRRNPELRLRGDERIPELCALQDRLLDAAAAVVAPGGALVYAVCTVTREEGPERVRTFLARTPSFALAPVPEALARFAAPLDGGVVLRTWTHRDPMDSFFAARLERH